MAPLGFFGWVFFGWVFFGWVLFTFGSRVGARWLDIGDAVGLTVATAVEVVLALVEAVSSSFCSSGFGG